MAEYEMNVTGITVSDKAPPKRKFPNKQGKPSNNFEKTYRTMTQVRRALISAQRELEAAKKRVGELKAAKPCAGCGRPTITTASRVPRGYGLCSCCWEIRCRNG
jgi:hypothetical protein